MMTRRPPKPPADYEVGRNRPPKETQFRKGQSGNPDGRPRGSRSAAKSPIEKLITRGIRMTVDGKQTRVPITAFTTALLMQQAKAGSVTAMRELNRMAEAERAAQRRGDGKDGVTEVNFTITGLETHVEEALCTLELATKIDRRLVLTLQVVADAVQRLGRPLTQAEQQTLARACPDFSEWYAGRGR